MGNATSSPKVTSQDKAILQVKLQKDKLVKYQRKMSLLVKSEQDQIKIYLRQGDKNSAKTLLKRTKYQEKLLEDVSSEMFNLENMIHNIEFKLIEKDFLRGLQKGNTILKKLNNEMRVEDVERLVDEVHENIAYQEEIEEALSTAVVGRDYEDEIDEELRAMEEQEAAKIGKTEDLKTKLPTTEGLPELPEPAAKVEEPVKKVKEKTGKTALLA
ncbi:Vacuolar protein sorting-associated protein 20 [Cyberlindnera fabianii]|uniref:Vacuolar protein sorting-associated protein 20 n=1 Tax=Cyberlindnera fabianii TaxID=36022 RepID=A0A1V2L910_CYBFA|nr:Vacuolar protein sorting-associated protein 20 [Cyberlindnera fabianii]